MADTVRNEDSPVQHPPETAIAELVEDVQNGAQESSRPSSNGESRKRKGNFQDSRLQHGSRKGGRNDGKRHPKSDMGRGEYYRENPDKRSKTGDTRDKRERNGNALTYGKEFSKEEIASEERRPKRKVAVLIGYSGTGYKGMQITPAERTIEGDLFKAFIDAGAISKANADDPKKAGLVRCARTDKGVHAAGNVINLKLIVEDDDIVEKINSHLSPQIRVWGIARTIGSFSCYQACDSRWYEYLIPSHAFLPPHPSSWLSKQMEAAADEVGDTENYRARQAEVLGFWESVEETAIKAILDEIDEDIRFDVVRALQGEEEANAKAVRTEGLELGTTKKSSSVAAPIKSDPQTIQAEPLIEVNGDQSNGTQSKVEIIERLNRVRAATKLLRSAYITAKRRYRIPKARIDRIQEALSKYVGTCNYHNFTIQKTYRDPSSKRHIKSFVVNPEPILIGDGLDEEKSEWLSLKVHGQSFMMHQIRKMVGMATLLIRSGSNLATLEQSMKEDKFSIPKVPGLGLLLERPVFDSYNANQAAKYDRQPLLFSDYEAAITEFKQREIYQRIFREEEERNEFHKFFNHIDNFKESYFLFVTSKGLDATKGVEGKEVPLLDDSSDGEADEGKQTSN